MVKNYERRLKTGQELADVPYLLLYFHNYIILIYEMN